MRGPKLIDPAYVRSVAKVCHEVNRVYCQGLGDFSQEPWGDAPEWQKESAIQGVKFHLTNPDSFPEDSHKNWLKAKEADGWQWGPVKDPERKQHPCMVPFESLPKEQQMKDHLFLAVVRSMFGGTR